MIRFFAYISLIALVLGCESNQVNFNDMEELNSFISNPENGFIKKADTPDLNFEAKLVPPIEGGEVNQITIHFRINRNDGGSVLEFGNVGKDKALEREGYLSFELLQDAYLEIGKKTVPALFHHYERNFGLKPSIDVFFNFNISKPEEDIKFFFRDQLFNQGLIQINFNKDLFNTCYVKKA